MNTLDELEKVKEKFLDALWADFRYSISKSDDQALLISSGALGVSLTFVKDVVPLQDSICMGFFYASIFCFAFTIMVGFINHRISARTIWKRYVELNNTDLSKPGTAPKQKLNPWIERINSTLTISLIAGIFLLITYCIINISNYKVTSNNNKTQKIINK
jgi:hypothetical protein